MRSRTISLLLTGMTCLYSTVPAWAQIIGPLDKETLQQWQRQGKTQQAANGTVPGLYYDPSNELSPSFSQLTPANKPGAFQLPTQYQASVLRQLGYNPSRAWALGATPDQILKIGDLQQSRYFKIGEMTLREIAARSGTSIDQIPLSQMALVQSMTVGELYQLYPQLNNVPLKDISFLTKTMTAAGNSQQVRQVAMDVASQRALQTLTTLDPRLGNVPLTSIIRGDWDQVLSDSKAAGAKLAAKELTKLHPELANLPLTDILNGNWRQAGTQALNVAQKVLLQDLGQNPALKGIPVLQLTQGDWGSTISQAQQTQLSRLLKQYPDIAQLPIDKAFPMANGVITGDWQSISNQALQQGLRLTGEELFTAVPQLKNMPLGALPLNRLSIKSLPGLADRPLKTLPNVAEKYVAELPGLSQVPVNKLPIDFVLSALMGDLFGRLDIAYAGATETPVTNVVTGGTKDQTFTPEPCQEKRCAHFELDNLHGGGPAGSLSGKAWVEGKAQKVEGGKGFLRTINGGKEPTGVPVWGTDAHVKLSLEDIEEGGNGKPSSARVWANFQFCISVPFLGEQCSPHFIPVPTPWQVQEGGMILVASTRAMPDFLRQERDRIQAEGEEHYAPDPYCEPGSTIATTPPLPQPIASTGKPPAGVNVAQQNEQRYLARIAAGESNGGRNIGPNPSTGAYGEYQFIRTTRNSILSRSGYDAWSRNKQTRDKAAMALIEIYGRQQGVNIRIVIRQGNFRLADRVLGRNQFTSLPGGAEQHVIWRNPATVAKYGPVGSAGAGTIPVYAGQPCSSIADGSGGLPIKSGPINQRIYQAATDSRRRKMDSSKAPGTEGGNLACAWAVNKVLNQAGVRTLGGRGYLSVAAVEADLNSGRGQRVYNRTQAVPGDIALVSGRHIGICITNGCTRVISNSSSRAKFIWESNTDFGGTYGQPSKIYRVMK